MFASARDGTRTRNGCSLGLKAVYVGLPLAPAVLGADLVLDPSADPSQGQFLIT